ncbi:23S rRNA (uracil(1939)-C(5))-methyltransferase RlmD [Cyanobacterium aponinum UTEX 3222]|uniref:23S rRNA (Uracil(1939)-C(5))-methyltransferase RlmD n=2 Tax=Cyanobacterium aponinum TaxID=379064 RepID=A0A844GSK7_9CHRO|nr:23S rRNA (uracil(1939)-C(5))-methyltransferase RlmD [Cyanobacterium aponinum]MBD2394532.1 23S rRNA (uracil(1939)-C(5))-methyltransferase RlmD [Cyanobacterium aponinum FACHB-4101]MTF39467.1 23S rRNA (uracil(1939)-C(5))-methyltransferase RlmD [Cyanobacterium aponinum 0216]WPF90392.1 23S rRNA (uracil(1939)-C(5))-methyltransferase RlmD [Cyanobacterium aponinum AL20115]WRL44032.1 23S rRNA (uracil(1939)-C(5))-methyltransferase RlmD [Cyanobacterium aponinum UTEX 3222]
MKQGDLVEVEIDDVSSEGSGVARVDQQVVFIPNTVTGDRISSRIVRVKKKYAQGQLEEFRKNSAYRIRPRCIVADKCGGCQWQHINYSYQLQLKQNQVKETLTRIGGFADLQVEPIISGEDLSYRNKVNYPLGVSHTGQIKAGYYRQGSHQIVNINQCPIQDQRLNPLLAEIKQDLQQLQIPIYDEKTHKGALRHLCFRIGKNTGEILLTLVSAELSDDTMDKQAEKWMKRYPNLVGVTLNYNPQKTNVIFGQKTELLAGRPYLIEQFARLNYHLRAETFFQVNTTVAEDLLTAILNKLSLTGEETVLDLYCGVGTFTLPFAQKVKKAIGVESYSLSIEQAQRNAEINNIDNVEFITETTETFLPTLEIKPDLVILDPPRKGCQTEVIESLKQIKSNFILYISCHPATLARDLQLLCQEGDYRIMFVQPADFFPQTPHVETAVILTRIS